MHMFLAILISFVVGAGAGIFVGYRYGASAVSKAQAELGKVAGIPKK
jgi:Na+-driven multidrug efflux pump